MVSLMYVQLHYNYRDNYCMGKINNFIRPQMVHFSNEENVYVGLADPLKVN